MTATEQIQQTQQTGFLNGYSHFAKLETAAKGEIRITVSVFGNSVDTAASETLKLYNQLKANLPKQQQDE